MFPKRGDLRSKLREIDAPRHTFQLERLCGHIAPGKTLHRPHLNQASRPFPETLRLLRGVYCTKSVSSETKSEPQHRKSRWENLSRPHRYSSCGGSPQTRERPHSQARLASQLSDSTPADRRDPAGPQRRTPMIHRKLTPTAGKGPPFAVRGSLPKRPGRREPQTAPRGSRFSSQARAAARRSAQAVSW